jgi:AraC-like DNA-binding protein
MLVYDAPDLERPEASIRRAVGPAPWSVSVLNGRGRHYSAEGRSDRVSLKFVLRGTANYDIDRRHHRLAGGQAMLIDAGRGYRIRTSGEGGMETFVLFADRSLLSEAWSSIVEPANTTPQWSATPVPLAKSARATIGSLARRLRENSVGADEAASLIALSFAGALDGEAKLHGLADRVSAVRRETRLALARALMRAEEYLNDRRHERVALDDLALAAGVSRFHLLRLFADVLGKTPHAYALSLKIEDAKRLLVTSRLPVIEIAAQLGFESQSAFTRAFRRLTKMTPSAYRALAS